MNDRMRSLQMNDGNRRWWALGAMCFALFMIMLDNTVVNVALPSIQRSLNASTSSLEWTVNAYTLSFAVLLVTGGRLGDLFGRRKIFLAGVVVFAGASAAIGFSPNDTWLVAWRAVQGVGAALMMPATLSIISNAFPPAERGKAIGTWAGRLGAGARDRASRRRLPRAERELAVDLLPQPARRRRRRPDRALRRARVPRRDGGEDGRRAGRAHPHGRARRAGARADPGQQLGLELRPASSCSTWSRCSASRALPSSSAAGAEPMVDFSFFRSRTFLGANMVAFIVSFAMLAMFFFLALYMQNIRHYTPLEAGIRFLPSTLMIVLIAPIAGRLADRVGPRPLMTFGLLAVAGSLFWQSPSDGLELLQHPAPGLRADGHRHGLRDVPDEHRGDERRRPGQGRRRVGHPLDEPDGRRHLRRRGARRDGQHARTLEDRPAAARPAASRRAARLADSLGSGGVLHGVPVQVVDASQSAFVYALQYGLRLGAAVALLGAVLAWTLVGRARAGRRRTAAAHAPAPRRRQPRRDRVSCRRRALAAEPTRSAAPAAPATG